MYQGDYEIYLEETWYNVYWSTVTTEILRKKNWHGRKLIKNSSQPQLQSFMIIL